MGRNAKTSPDARALRMIEMWRSGLTLAQIGSRYGVSRQRVEQILRRWDVACMSGGITKVAIEKRARRQAMRDAIAFRRFGCTVAQRHEIGAAIIPYRNQKRSANARGISWDLNLKQWWDLWQESGHWNQRGRHAHEYCMSRLGDAGPYALGNIFIGTCRENGQEYQALRSRLGRKRSATPGVYRMYPGMTKPYVAKHGRRCLGHFRTIEEGLAAKAKYIASIRKAA